MELTTLFIDMKSIKNMKIAVNISKF